MTSLRDGLTSSEASRRPSAEIDESPFDRRLGPLGGPPPKFRQYALQDFRLLRVLGKGAFGKVGAGKSAFEKVGAGKGAFGKVGAGKGAFGKVGAGQGRVWEGGCWARARLGRWVNHLRRSWLNIS